MAGILIKRLRGSGPCRTPGEFTNVHFGHRPCMHAAWVQARPQESRDFRYSTMSGHTAPGTQVIAWVWKRIYRIALFFQNSNIIIIIYSMFT